MEKYTFLELKKMSKKNFENCLRVAFIGEFATQHLAVATKGYAQKENFPLDILDCDYDQFDAQILDKHSETYEFHPDFILLAVCTEKLYLKFCETPLSERRNFAEQQYQILENYWLRLSEYSKARILQMNYEEIDDGIWGNYAGKTEVSFLYQLRKLNMYLMQGAQKQKNLYLVDICRVAAQCGESIFKDDKFYYIAKIPFSQKALVSIAGEIVSVIKAVSGKIIKCIVTDLDNTLWGGVIGDDGLEGIQIGELGDGHAFTEMQRWLKELRKRGILLAVCSKNNEDTAKIPFERHPEMELKLDDFVMFVANWEDKATNIRKIQETLNIGMDSIVFLDDNPRERDVVRTLIPEVIVPELPKDPALYLSYLRKCNLFETAVYSSEDNERTEQYQAEAERRSILNKSQSYEDYLKEMDMVAEAKPFDEFHYPRIAQLSQRSNQFNLRTVRYTEDEIRKLAEDKEYLTLYFTLKDKLGSSGLISIVVLKRLDKDNVFIENWLMSCRVLKRTMEEFIINKILYVAEMNGFQKVIGEYKKTAKNAMVEKIYEKMGFHHEDGGIYTMKVSDYKKNLTYIKEEE